MRANWQSGASVEKSGREVFSRYKNIIHWLSWLTAFLPTSIRRFLWNGVDNRDGRVAVLIRYLLLKCECPSVGDNVYIGKRVTIKNGTNFHVGSNVSIHEGCYIDAAGGCRIGDNVSIAHGCSIISFNHTWADPAVPIKYNPILLSPVLVESDVWIGCAARLMPGCRVAQRSVVAAGCVVISEHGNNELIAGVPGRMLKQI